MKKYHEAGKMNFLGTCKPDGRDFNLVRKGRSKVNVQLLGRQMLF